MSIEAMKLPPLPSHDEHFMTCAHVYTADQMQAYALQARAQVQGELSVDQMREMLSVHKLAIVPMRATHAMLDAMSDDDWQWSDLLAAAEAITEDEHDWIDATPQPAQATQAEVTDEQILATGREWSKEQGWWDFEANDFLGCARAILALRPERVPMTGEQWTDVLGSAGPDMLDLAKQWADNKIHVYQVVNQAEKIVKAAVLRGITAQIKKETP